MKTIILFSFLIGGGAARALEFRTCDEALRWVGGLDAEQRAAIEAVAERDFSVRIFRKRIDGVPRTLFLVGEAHVKAPGPARAGTRLVRSFEHFAKEGLPFERYWFGPAVKAFVERGVDDVRGDAVEPRSEGSTLDEATWLAVARNIEDGLLLALDFEGVGEVNEALVRLHLDRMLERLGDPGFLELVKGHALFPGADGLIYVNDDFPRVLREGAKRVDLAHVVARAHGRAGPPVPTTEHRLERQYRPSAWRKLNAAWMVAADRLSGLTQPILIYPSVALFGASLATLAVNHGQPGIAATLITGAFLTLQGAVKFGLEKSYAIFSDVENRNRTMMAEIDAIFRRDAQVSQLLFIAGDYHSSGLDGLALDDGYEALLHFPMLMEVDGELRTVAYE